MTPEQKQQILDNAPEGATHYSDITHIYYRNDSSTNKPMYWFPDTGSWLVVGTKDWFLRSLPLNSLREPDQENWSEEDERRMDVIGSNGNGAEHYAELEKQKRSKYHREIKPGVWIDVYDVIVAWAVSNPALQHLIKKALQPGERGHKDLATDMQDIVVSAVRAQQIEDERVK